MAHDYNRNTPTLTLSTLHTLYIHIHILTFNTLSRPGQNVCLEYNEQEYAEYDEDE